MYQILKIKTMLEKLNQLSPLSYWMIVILMIIVVIGIMILFALMCVAVFFEEVEIDEEEGGEK